MFTLHNGDCLPFLRSLKTDSVDMVITDPPYPELQGGLEMPTFGGVAKTINKSVSVGDIWNASLDWMPEAWRVCKYGMIVFCSYHSVDTVKAQLRDSAIALATWYKRNSAPSVNNVPHFSTEYFWLFKKEPGVKWRQYKTHYDIPAVPGGCMGDERIREKDGTSSHPTQKPIKLMRQLVSVEGFRSVLDPFMGTGTTGVACIEFDKAFIGCELKAEYFSIAEKRIKSAVLSPSFFTPSNNRLQPTAFGAGMQAEFPLLGNSPADESPATHGGG